MDSRPKKLKGSGKDQVVEPVDHPTIEFPSPVFSLLVATVKDASFLKTARLVCKSWNPEATRALRNCSFVKLKENDKEAFAKFCRLLFKGGIGSHSDLPSPFLNIHVETSSFSHQEFYDFFEDVDPIVTKLSLFPPYPLEQFSNFQRFWARHAKTLEEVSVLQRNMDNYFECIEISRREGSIRIDHLSHDADCLKGYLGPCLLQTFLKMMVPDILLWFDLEHLDHIFLAYFDEETLIKLFTAEPRYLEHVKWLDLVDVRISSAAYWDTFFSNLKELEIIRFGSDVSNELVSHRLSKIPTLKYLTFDWDNELSVEVVRDSLSHLKKINIPNGVGNFKKAMNQLRESLPGVQVVHVVCGDYGE